jgi:Ca2+/Na+ antiporter
MLTIGIIALIQPIHPTTFAVTISTSIFIILSVILVYWRSQDGGLSKKDGAVLIGIYGLFLLIQYLTEVLL